MKNKDFEKSLRDLDIASEALLKIEEVTTRLLSAAEAIAQLQALKDALEEAQNKPGAI